MPDQFFWGSSRAELLPDGSLHLYARCAGPRKKKHALVVMTPSGTRQLTKYLVNAALAKPKVK